MIARLRDQSGITLIEILIAAVIFMIGFSTLILLMNSTLVKFSTRELLHTNQLANEVMATSLALRDTTAMDTTLTRGGVEYRVTRRVSVEDHLVRISVDVLRAREDRKITELYDAFAIHKR